MVNCRDDRLGRAAQRNRTFDQFLKRFHDEFGKQISPTVLLIREDAPESVQRFAIVSFRDAVCACAIVLSQARRLAWGRATGIPYSDAFDVYPWVPGLVDDGRVYAFTPSMGGIHDVKLLRGQPTPPSGQGSLSASDIDAPLLASNSQIDGNERLSAARTTQTTEVYFGRSTWRAQPRGCQVARMRPTMTMAERSRYG